MATEAPPAEVLLIREQEISVRTMMLPQADLRFYVDNPRIYSIMHPDGIEPTQEDIQRKLLEMDHVKTLIQDIKLNGGLTDAVIVRDKSWEVLEGNSRLAAFRYLAKIDPIKWGQIKCTLLPNELDEGLIFALLGQYHIKGKKDWAPFEQAGFLYRRSLSHNMDAAQLAQEMGLSAQKVRHLIATYEFMVSHQEIDTSRWSYYDEYLKNRVIRNVRQQYGDFDALVVEKIKSGEIERAVEVREQLPVICKAPKILKKFRDQSYDFVDAYQLAVDAGVDSGPYKRLAEFRRWLDKPETTDALIKAKGEAKKRIGFELAKLKRSMETIHRKWD